MELKFILLKKFYQLRSQFRRSYKYPTEPNSIPATRILKTFPETYHLMIRIYQSGRLRDVIRTLPVFAEQGIRQVWLSPLHSQSKYTGNDHGYWPETHLDIDPLIGDKKDLHELIDRASRLNIQILLDAPINHVGYDAKFKLNGKKILLNDLSFFRKSNTAEKKDKLLWDLLNSVKEKHEFREIQKLIHQRPLYGLPTFVHENEKIQEYLIASYKRFVDHGITSFRIDAANIIPIDFQVRFINELTDYGDKRGRSVIFFLDLWLRDKPLEFFLDQMLPRLKKENIFIDDTHLTSLMRVAVFHENSFKNVKETLRGRMVQKRLKELLVVFPESHDYHFPLKKEFDKFSLYLIGEFCSQHPLILHHGKEDIVEGHISNRDSAEELNFQSGFFKAFSRARKAIAPYKTSEITYSIEENTPDEVIVLRLGGKGLVLIVNIGKEYTYQIESLKNMTTIVSHGDIKTLEGHITLSEKSLILMEIQ